MNSSILYSYIICIPHLVSLCVNTLRAMPSFYFIQIPGPPGQPGGLVSCVYI